MMEAEQKRHWGVCGGGIFSVFLLRSCHLDYSWQLQQNPLCQEVPSAPVA